MLLTVWLGQYCLSALWNRGGGGFCISGVFFLHKLIEFLWGPSIVSGIW